MTGFDADWLAQREPFDLAARSRPLEHAFSEALEKIRSDRSPAASTLDRATPHFPIRLADLGGGTAANFRALAPRLRGDQEWLLLDHDPRLLAEAPSRIAHWAQAQGWQAIVQGGRCEVHARGAHWSLATQAIDLAECLETIDATRYDGIVTTAFLDLVSQGWLARLARWLVNAGRPMLATLTVDGLRRWHPEATDDALIEQAFRAHQGGDKGFGESVGPGAAAALAQILQALACPVSIARSDWQIGAADLSMLNRMADEAVGVALEVDPASRDRVSRWREIRALQIQRGDATLTIGHVDLLAWPGRAVGGTAAN